MKNKTLCMADFDDMSEKGIKQIVMNKRKFEDFKNTLIVKDVLQKESGPSSHVRQIHTDHGNIQIRTEENHLDLNEGQTVRFNTPYGIGDLVHYKHGGSYEKDKRTHYSKVIRILPFIDEDNFSLRFKYVMENARVVPFEDILSLELKGPSGPQETESVCPVVESSKNSSSI